MFRKNVVLIKKKRKKIIKNKDRVNVFFRTFFMASLVMMCIISFLILSIQVDEKSRQTGFGTTEGAIDIFEEDTNYVMNFFSKKVEISKDKTRETINSVLDFASCFMNPLIRAVWQGVELIT